MHEKIKAHREARGWTLAHLGKVAGISDRTLARIERGETCHVATLVKVCDALGLRTVQRGELLEVTDDAS